MRVTRAAVAIVFVASSVVGPVVAPGTANASGTPIPSGDNWLPSTPTYSPLVTGKQTTDPQTITAGAQWRTETYQTVGGAQDARVMNLDLTNPNVRMDAVEAGDKLIDPADETISSMATRTGAVAGVNSDFLAINATGQPNGMLVRGGVLEASPVASWPQDLEVLKNGQGR
jgi:hypothetical protein